MMTTGPIKIGIDASELNSAIKKAKRLGGILRSIEKRVDNIAKKQEGIGGFFDEFAPISDDAWRTIIGEDGMSYRMERAESFGTVLETNNCRACKSKPAHSLGAGGMHRLRCKCYKLEHEDIETLLYLWNYANKQP